MIESRTADIQAWPWMETPLEIKGFERFPSNLPLSTWVFKVQSTYSVNWKRDSEHPSPPHFGRNGYIVFYNDRTDTYEYVASVNTNQEYLFKEVSKYTKYKEVLDEYDSILALEATVLEEHYFWYPNNAWAYPLLDPNDFYDNIPPGNNTFRFSSGAVFYTNPYPAEEIYHDAEKLQGKIENYAYDDFNITIDPAAWDVPTDSIEINFVNEKDWSEWLPTAPYEIGEAPDTLTLQFSLDKIEPGRKYRFQAKLYDITWYPGRWVNDYRWLAGNNPQFDEWSPKTGYKWPEDEDLCDIVVDKVINPNWSVYWKVTADTTQGYYELQYEKPISDKKEVVELKLLSRDFSASARLVAGVRHWREGDYYLGFHQLPIYMPRFQHDPANPKKSYVLPIPRDEEVAFYAVPDSFKNSAYDTVSTGFGDRLGDPWEDKFVVRPDNLSDTLIYSSILDCYTYMDDSNHDQSFYSLNTPSEVKSRGDGFTNFEKYRGFYGLKETPGQLYHRRLSPQTRNVFVVSLQDDSINDNSGSGGIIWDRENKIDYFNNIAIRTHLLQKNPIMSDDQVDFYYKFDRSFIDSLVNVGSIVNQDTTVQYYKDIKKLFAGKMILNSVIDDLTAQNQQYSTWIYFWRKQTDILRGFYRYAINDSVVYNSIPWSDTGGLVISDPIPSDPVYLQGVPKDVRLCHIFYDISSDYIKDLVNYGHITAQDSCLQLIEKISTQTAHELGHFIGMGHRTANDTIDSIMNETVDYPFQKNFKPRDYRTMLLFDWR